MHIALLLSVEDWLRAFSSALRLRAMPASPR
jgi:hypothetical protein